MADEPPPAELPPEPEILTMPGTIDGTGTHFELSDSPYLNITLDSSQPIKLTLESISEMVLIHLESATDAISTDINLGGFLPGTTYHKYDDDYTNHTPFTTDSSGSYAFTQDLTQPHFIFIQTRESTIFLTDYGWSNTGIGTWDPITRTGTLTIDVTETIQVNTNNVTLNGNGHKVTGSVSGFGLYLGSRTGVTVTNLNVSNFVWGIRLENSNGNTLISNSSNSNRYGGIYLYRSSGNVLANNTVSFNKDPSYQESYGIDFASSSNNNNLTGNQITSNDNGIRMMDSNYNTLSGNVMQSTRLNFSVMNGYIHNIDTTNTVNLKPMYYLVNLSGVVIDSSSNAGFVAAVNCTNITVRGLSLSKNFYGVLFINTSGSLVENVQAFANQYGIYLENSSGNTLFNNKTNSNRNYGIYNVYSSNNTIKNNQAYSNLGNGIQITYGAGSTVQGNTVSNSQAGFDIVFSDNCVISDNSASSSSVNAGIQVRASNNCQITNNTATSNKYCGIFFSECSNSTITGNIVYSNQQDGIIVAYASNDNLTGNTIRTNPHYGLYLYNATNNKIYFNNFISNATQIYVEKSTGNVFNLTDSTPPVTSIDISGTPGSNSWYTSDVTVTLTATDSGGIIGGNYWSNWTSPDNNGDGFVDNPYVFTGGVDNLPFVSPVSGGGSGGGVDSTEYSFNGADWNLYSAPLTISTEGMTTVYYRSTDKAGNVENTRAETIKIDKTPPVIIIDSPAEGYYKTDQTVTWEVTDTNLDTVMANYPSPTTFSDEGTYQVTVSATDLAGNTATASSPQFTIDKTPPDISISGVEDGAYYNMDVTPSISVTDTNLDTSSITLNDAPFASGTIVSDEDEYTLRVTATDLAGNEALETVSFTVDKTPPVVTVSRDPETNAAGWNNTDVTVHFEATDELSGIDGDSFFEVLFTLEEEDQSASHTFSDKAGNSTSVTEDNINIDKTDPAITVNAPQANEYLASDMLTLDFAASDALSGVADLSAQLNGSPVTSGQVINTSTMDGSYALQFRANDRAGNSAFKQVIFSVKSARALKTGAVEELQNAKTDNKKVDKVINQAIKDINKSLDPDLWLDASHLIFSPKTNWLGDMFDRFSRWGRTVEDDEMDNEDRMSDVFRGFKHGITVFHQENAAVVLMQANIRDYEKSIPELERLIALKESKGKDATKEKAELNAIKAVLPVFREVVADLVKADMILAQVAITDAKNTPVTNPRMSKIVAFQIKQAEREFAWATQVANNGWSGIAISRYSHAWLHAQMAIKFANLEIKGKH